MRSSHHMRNNAKVVTKELIVRGPWAYRSEEDL